MLALWGLLRTIKCRLGWCGGDVCSGWHDGVLWIGWKCRACGAVRHYAPTDQRSATTPDEYTKRLLQHPQFKVLPPDGKGFIIGGVRRSPSSRTH
jgi:hypothetical protein